MARARTARSRAGRGDGAPEIVGADAARARAALATAPPRRARLPPRFGPLTADDDARSSHRARRAASATTSPPATSTRSTSRAGSSRGSTRPATRSRCTRALAEVAPAPYGALIEADGVTVISGSPERFLASVGERIETRPIKGTRRARPGGADELAAADEGRRRAPDDRRPRAQRPRPRSPRPAASRVDELGYVVELPALLPQGLARQREAARAASATPSCCARRSPAARSPARRRSARCS